MKIGLVIYGDLATLSGGYLYDRLLVDYLRRCGDTVEVVSIPPASYGRCLGQNFSTPLREKLCNADFDILLQDELNHPSLFLLNRFLRRRVSYPVIGIIHHLRCSEQWSPIESACYRWIEKRYLKTLDGFVFNSHTSSATIDSLISASQPSVIAYPGGNRLEPDTSDPRVDNISLEKKIRSDGPVGLLFVGNVIPRKGLHTLIEALALLSEKDWTLDIVGRPDVDSGYTRAIKERVENLGLEDKLVWSAALNDEQLKSRYRLNHVLVVPSQYEGFGIVYLEAKGFGLPGIATDAGAAHEIIEHGTDGFLVPPENAQALANCLGQFIDDRQRLLKMSQAGIRRYKMYPTWTQSAAKIRTFLEGFV